MCTCTHAFEFPEACVSCVYVCAYTPVLRTRFHILPISHDRKLLRALCVSMCLQTIQLFPALAKNPAKLRAILDAGMSMQMRDRRAVTARGLAGAGPPSSYKSTSVVAIVLQHTSLGQIMIYHSSLPKHKERLY